MRSDFISIFFAAVFLSSPFCAAGDDQGIDPDRVTLSVIGMESTSMGKTGPKKKGIVAVGVFPHSAAAKAKLGAMDSISAINGKPTQTLEQWNEIRSTLNAGERVVLDINPYQGASWGSTKKINFNLRTAGQDALGALRVEDDKVSGNAFYFHADSPKSPRREDDIGIYFSAANRKADGLIIRMCRDDSVHVCKEMLISDGRDNRALIKLNPFKWDTQFGGGDPWQWADHALTKSEVEGLWTVLLNPNVTVRFSSDSTKKDRELKGIERARMVSVLVAYRAMGGKY